MLTNKQQNRFYFKLVVILAGVLLAITAGFLAGGNPLYLGLILVVIPIVFCFFSQFEYTVLGLLILRSALDPFSAQQLPAAFAIGVDGLTLIYVVVQLLTRQAVHTDRFWWFFAGWVSLQGLWVVLMPLGGLGLDESYLSGSIREWIRLFSWLMVYLLVMQLKNRLSPQKVISALFLGLIIPVTIGLLQMFVPSSLPTFLSGGGEEISSIPLEEISRINGTLGLANTFATFLLLFIGLTLWKLNHAERRWFWLILLGTLALLFVGTKSLFSLIMLGIFVVVWIAPKLSLTNLIGGILLVILVIGIFGSSEFGQERLGSLSETPLFNSDIDLWRAILLSGGDGNSFNWRLSHWYLMLQQWQFHPVLGYGLASSILIGNGFLAHNDYIRALVEEGICGFLMFLCFLILQASYLTQIIRSPFTSNEQRSLGSILLAVLAGMAGGMLTENIWSHTTLFFYWWALISIIGWNWKEEKTENQ